MTIIIAEAGVNHNGDLDTALRLVDAAVLAGADIVKFQTFKANSLVTLNADKAAYQKKTTDASESQFLMLKKLELTLDMHLKLIEYCRFKDIKFLSTPFDKDSVNLLSKLGQSLWKIPSGEITNLPYLRLIGSLGHSIILSTGMSNLGEVRDALSVLQKSGTSMSNITVLHCTTEYPAPLEEINLRSMLTIKEQLNVDVGYSDHTHGISIPIAACALGASVIEKHLTLDRNMPGPDHLASLEPEEFSQMVKAIREIETSLGNGVKQPTKSELKNMLTVRKSIVASTKIEIGDTFTPDNLCVKRPGTGTSPMMWDQIIGTKATRTYSVDEPI